MTINQVLQLLFNVQIKKEYILLMYIIKHK